jgi:dTDP-4-amino-4,6-dideoxygalactose transaminase
MYRNMPSAHPNNLPVAKDAARKVLCLPIYPALTMDEVNLVTGIFAEQ